MSVVRLTKGSEYFNAGRFERIFRRKEKHAVVFAACKRRIRWTALKGAGLTIVDKMRTQGYHTIRKFPMISSY